MGDMSRVERLLDAYTLFYYGDALGFPMEFLPVEFIIENQLSDLYAADRISDDSQLMFLCMKNILSRGKTNYLRSWLDMMKKDSSLVRAPGDSCLFAARRGYPRKDSKGSGGLMRVPAFFCSRATVSDVILSVQKDTQLTHVEENTVAASAFYYLWVHALMQDCEWKFDADEINRVLTIMGITPFVFPSILADNDVWTAEEVMKFIFDLVSNRPDSPEELMKQAVTIDGDSDTVGALVGFVIPFLYEREQYIEIIKNIQGEVVEYRDKTKSLLKVGQDVFKFN